jgi:hypothetical protein
MDNVTKEAGHRFLSIICPISLQPLLDDAVLSSNGQAFSNMDIERWYNQARLRGERPRCPLTNTVLSSADLRPFPTLSMATAQIMARLEAMEVAVGLFRDSFLGKTFTPSPIDSHAKHKLGGLTLTHYCLWLYIGEAGEPPSDVLVLSALCCPLTHKPFQTPVMASDDRVYEEAAILHLFEQADRVGYIARSPLSDSPLLDRKLLPAPALTRVQEELEGLLCDVRRAIHQTLDRLGALFLERGEF